MEIIGGVLRLRAGFADVPDILANILGYVALGVVLGHHAVWQALGIATGVSMFAEATQLVSVGRSSSVLDVAANVLGTLIGTALSARWNIGTASITINTRKALFAATVALGYVSAGTGLAPRFVGKSMVTLANDFWVSANTRGTASDGRLEAHWGFDSNDGQAVLDSSGNDLNGLFVGAPAVVAGLGGYAVRLNGVNQYVSIGSPTVLRLKGSITLTATINPSSFPADDATIVSNRGKGELGYQLDTTVDQGSRTIGFKLADASGRIMARYGRTPLHIDTWYHVAGIYDSERQTIDVYLNGREDNDCLIGVITAKRLISGAEMYVGRRPELSGFEFSGSIDDVKIYSRALTAEEVRKDIPESLPIGFVSEPLQTKQIERRLGRSGGFCKSFEAPDSSAAGFVVAYGLLVVVGFAGLWPRVPTRLACLTLGCAAGFALVGSANLGPSLFPPWALPLLTLTGSAAAVVSLRQ
jgi:hypothetical protein